VGWRGQLPAVVRRGVGVAVIDSGIDTRQQRAQVTGVVAAMDFTAGTAGISTGTGPRGIGQSPAPRLHRPITAGFASGAYLIDLRALATMVGVCERRDRGDRLGGRAPPQFIFT